MLAGRRAELDAVGRLLGGARAGRAGALLVCGEPGIGKTALLRAAAGSAEGMERLEARGLESEAELPFAGLLDLVRPLVGLLDRLPALQSAVLAAAVALGPRGPDPPDSGPGDRLAVCAAAHALVGHAAAARPHLIVVEDLQWLDAPSRECVLYLARRLPAGVALIAAWREEREPPPHELPTLRLDRLEEHDATALLHAQAPELAPEVAARVVDAAAGVPLALVELLAGLTPEQRSGTAPVAALPDVGPGLRRAFGRRIDALSLSGRTALVVLAAHGAAELAPVVRALGHLRLDPGALAEAEAIGLLRLDGERAELVHPLAGSVAYREAEPAERRRAHAALAAVLEGERAAWHLAAAATSPSEQIARALERTAVEARARRAHATASAALERAARLSPEDAPRARRLMAAAMSAASAGQTQGARRLLAEVEALATQPVLRLQCADLRGFLEAWDGDVLDGGELLERSANEHARDDPLAGAALLADAAMVATVAGDCQLALRRAEAARALLPDGPSPVRAKVLGVLSWALTLGAHGERARELTAAAEPWLRRFDPLSPEAQFLLIALNVRSPGEDYEGARAHALAIAAAAREAGALAALPIALSIAADAGQRLGRWDAALADLVEIVELSDATGQRMPLVHALGVRARLEAATGNDEAARAAAERAVAVGAPSHIGSMIMFATASLGFLELGRGDVDAALPTLERCEWMADFSGMEDPILIPWAPDLVEALVRADRIDDARRVSERLARCARTSGTATAAALAGRCRGLVAPGAGDADFEQAIAHPGRMPFELARTRLAYGTKLRRARRAGDARRQLHEALARFEALGAAPWAEQAREELRASGGRRRARRQDLTPAELRVARVIARGATNREAAAELFVSPKTVDFHLRQAYRKLGVRNRTELTLALRGREPEA